jgi:hypothetical protein
LSLLCLCHGSPSESALKISARGLRRIKGRALPRFPSLPFLALELLVEDGSKYDGCHRSDHQGHRHHCPGCQAAEPQRQGELVHQRLHSRWGVFDRSGGSVECWKAGVELYQHLISNSWAPKKLPSLVPTALDFCCLSQEERNPEFRALKLLPSHAPPCRPRLPSAPPLPASRQPPLAPAPSLA